MWHISKESSISYTRSTQIRICSIWNPLPCQPFFVNKLEMVQRRAASFAKNDYARTSSVAAMLEDFKWPTLQKRKKYSRLAVFYKAVHNQSAVVVTPYVQRSARPLRGDNDRFTPPPPQKKILVGMCRGKVKTWQGLRNELPVERENGDLRNELEPFELENWGLRNELEPFWAWKCGAPERPLTRGAAQRLKMRISGTAANPRRCRTRWTAVVGGDERVKIKESLKMMVSGTAKSAKKC